MAGRCDDDKSGQRVKNRLAMVETVQQSNEQMKADLVRESRESRYLTNPSAMKSITILQNQVDLYAKKIEIERKKIESLDKQIASAQMRVLEQRQKVGGLNASAENNQLIARQITTLENRLDKALVKFNESLANNKNLRERIEAMRRERVVFDGIYKKLERELHERKKEMATIIDESNEAYRARDKAQGELMALRQQAEKDRIKFEKEWKELGRLIDEDRINRDTLRKKQLNETLGIHSELETTDDHTKDRLSKHQDEDGESTSWHGSEITFDPSHSELERNYSDAFLRIKRATGIESTSDILSSFLEAEEKNFSLFNYVNSLNSEIERLELSISEQKGEIESYKGQGVSTDSQQKRVVRNLEEQILRTAKKVDEYEERYNSALNTVNQLKQGIHSIFLRMGPTQIGKNEGLIGNQGVTEANMMQYLGIIEQRTNEIIAAYAHSQNVGDDATTTSMISTSTPSIVLQQNHGSIITIKPPTLDDASSGENTDDDSERPLTRSELKSRTLKNMFPRE